MKFDWRFKLDLKFDWQIVFLILLFFQLLIGNDLAHHLRFSELYHEMIVSGKLILYDSKLLFSEPLVIYGILPYVLSGLIWSFAGKLSVDIIMIFLTIISLITINKLFKDDDVKFFASCLMLFLIPFDGYIAMFANTLFWLAVLLYKNNNKYYVIPLIFSAISHPFSLIASFYFVIKNKKNLIWWIPGLLMFLALSLVFKESTEFTLLNTARLFFTLIIRLLLSYSVLFNKNVLKVLGAFTLMGIIIGISTEWFFIVLPTNYDLIFTELEDFPNITEGNLRIMDYFFQPLLCQLSNINATITNGLFFENIPSRQAYFKYWNERDYFNYLNDNNISAVLFCKYCTLTTNEFFFFNTSNKYWENEDYILFKVG